MVRTLSLLTALLATCTLSLGAAGAGDASRTLARLRALESYALMQRYFYVPATHSFNGTYPPIGRRHAQVWPYSQALSATLELAQLPNGGAGARDVLQQRISTLAAYRAPFRELAYAPLYGGKGNAFYDDNAWIGIDLVEAAALLNDEADLDAAQRVLIWMESGWDARARACRGGVYWLMPGGKYWNRSPRARYRSAVSTANGALLAVLLYDQTHRRADLAWAKKAYAWTADCLGTGDGLIADHIDAAGNVTVAIHSYNQGAMVATAVDLYRVTHRHAYLADALRIADASLAAFQDPLGSGEEASMLSIYYGDLMTLAPIARGGEISRAVTSFANRAWAEERDPATGLFHFGHTLATLLDQSAMVQVYAELARAD